MNKRNSTPFQITRLSLAAILALGSTVAQSQQAPADKKADESKAEVSQLDKVTVTARRREETLKDVPVAVTALSAQALETLDVKDLGDLQGQVPSLTVYAARGSNSTLTTFIRGVGQADPLWGVDPGVGIYFDDVFIARPQGALLEVFDVQRIEVLRGPQGTLYGKNTIGGAIKYVSRPLEAGNGGSISLGAGNYGQLNVKAAANFSSADGELRGRVAGASLKRDGYGKNLTDGSDVSNQDTQAGRINVGYFPTSLPFTVQLSADETRDKSNMRGFQRMAANAFDPLKTPPMASRYDIASGMPNKNNTTSKGNSLTATWAISEAWAAKYITAERRSDTSTGIDFDGLPNKIADVLATYKDKSRSHELQLSYDGSNSNGVMGLYAFDGQAGGQVLNNFINLIFGDTHGTVFTKGKAAYADWSWKLSPRLGASAGVRYTQEEKHAVVLNRSYSDATFSTITAVSADFDKTRKVSNTAPKLGLDYKLNDQTNLYASLSRGFKSGGYNVRANTAAVPASAKPFDDEILDSLELGSKMSFDGGRFELNTAVFSNNYKNVQLSVFTSYTLPNNTQGFFGDFTNAGQGTVQGFEAEYQFLPSENWVVSGNLAWLDAKYDEYNFYDPSVGATVNIADEETFTNAPDFSGAINVEWRTDLANGGRVSARVGYSYQSDVVATTETKRATTPPLAPFGRPPISQDGYGLVNAGVIWNVNDNWTLSLQGTNLADEEYMTTGYNLNQAVGVYTGFYGAPRQYSLMARYDF